MLELTKPFSQLSIYLFKLTELLYLRMASELEWHD